METPASTRRVTRSQTKNAIPISKKVEESEKSVNKSRTRNMMNQQQERSALIDITNDSPIVGLALGTPSSAVAKQRSSWAKNVMTPGSGEALLRGQVKTLLQKVEEEAQLSKLQLESRPSLTLQGLVRSPGGLLNPTPANTPQVGDLSADATAVASPIVVEDMNIAQMMNQSNLIGRSLLLDFSDKTECSSMATDQGVILIATEDSCYSKSEEDSCSVWSIQGNAGTEEEETVEEEEEEEEEYKNYCHSEEECGVDELCKDMRKLTMAKFEGKHKRFVYNSDGEMEGEEEVSGEDEVLPTPKGKHLLFPHEDGDD